MSSKEILNLIEQFEGSLDTYNQKQQQNNEELLQCISSIWRNMKNQEKELEKLNEIIREQKSELLSLNTNNEEQSKKISELKAKKDELVLKITELKNSYENLINELKKPKFELESLTSNLESLNTKIDSKNAEKSMLEQKKIENESRETELTSEYQNKMANLESDFAKIKKENFFSSFLIENSDQDIPEVEILAKLIDQQVEVNIDEIKKVVDIPPIMAVRTIKQLALKEVIDFDEDTNMLKML